MITLLLALAAQLDPIAASKTYRPLPGECMKASPCKGTPIRWRVYTTDKQGKTESSPWTDRDYHACLRNLDNLDVSDLQSAGCERVKQ